MPKSETQKIKLGRGTVTATYKRLNAVAQPGATVGHHDFVESPALGNLRRALKEKTNVR